MNFEIVLGPIHSHDLGSILNEVQKHAPLKSVNAIESGKRSYKKSRKPKKIVTPEAIETMQRLRDNGNNMCEIARLTGYSDTTVGRYTTEPKGKQGNGKKELHEL